MKPVLLAGLLASTVLASAAARGDDKTECIEASQKGQTARDAHKLIEAREQFRVCARQQCPAVVQKDCASWLDGVERSLPTVVVRARDGAGADLVDVPVTVDGALLTTRLDGQAIPMNPGSHAFHFELADGTSADLRVLVTEGAQNQIVAVVLARAAPLPAPPAPPPPVITTVVPPPGGGSSSWRTVGWVVGAAGVVGLAVGAVSGVMAMNDKNSANCADKLCDAGPLGSARGAATASDIGFIGGGALLAAGVALVLLSPGGGHEAATLFRVAPMVGASGGGMTLAGTW